MKQAIANLFFVSVLVAAIGGCDTGSTLTNSSTPAQRYDPNSTSEENRRMVRDKMIEQGTDPAEAEAFTS